MLKVEQWAIDKLVPYARNPRKNDAQVDRMVSAIKEFGFRIPVVAKSDGSVVDGHLRLKAAQKMGMTEVPVALADELTEAQVKAFRLLANQSANWAEWDDDLLRLELEELKGMDFDLALTGFELGELDAVLNMGGGTVGLTDPDEVPEVQETPVTKEGDIWQLGKHRLMCGDSTDAGSVCLLMQNEKADMVLSDPPYGMRLDTDFSTIKGSMKSLGRKNNTQGNKYSKVIGDNDDFSPNLINTFFDNFDYCKEVFLFGADYYAELIPEKNQGSWLVWDKRKESQADAIGSEFELIWSKNKHKRRILRHDWFGFLSSQNGNDATNRVHPTQKPITLIEDILTQWGNGAYKIVDLYGGSGSTLIACEKTGRVCRMMELAPHYCDVIVKRWQDFTGQKATLESNGKTFDYIAGERAAAL